MTNNNNNQNELTNDNKIIYLYATNNRKEIVEELEQMKYEQIKYQNDFGMYAGKLYLIDFANEEILYTNFSLGKTDENTRLLRTYELIEISHLKYGLSNKQMEGGNQN